MSSLAKRIVTAAVLLPPVLIAVYAGPAATTGVLIVVAYLGSRELARLVEARGIHVTPVTMSIGAVLLLGTFGGYLAIGLPGALIALLVFCLIVQLLRPGGDMLLGLPVSFLGAVYLGFLPAHLLGLYSLGEGEVSPWPVYFALGLVWAADTGAYAGGSLLGRHKLWPRVSPSKSWEGAVIGLVVPVLVAILLGGWVRNLSLLERIIGGLLVGLFAQIGDLAESLMKREAAMKDSGKSFPGHGGILDRLDSLVLAVPVLYYWLRIAVESL